MNEMNLLNQSIRINEREYTFNNVIDIESTEQISPSYICPLSYLITVDIHGEKSCDFLQGQLTCDVTQVSTTNKVQGLYCSAKGRIISLFDLLLIDEHYTMIMGYDIAHSCLNKLQRYAQFSKVKLNTTETWCLFGLIEKSDSNNNSLFCLPQNNNEVKSFKYGIIYKKTLHAYVILVKQQYIEKFYQYMEKNYAIKGSIYWHHWLLKQKQIEIYPISQGLYLPHRLGLQHLNYLSFNKGCYVGQEIIARTHYLAKLKHDLYLYKIKKINCQIGEEIYSLEGKKIGNIVDYCPISNDKLLIALTLNNKHESMIMIGESKVRLKE
jgi:tRNA-modifying protein YgfZ